MFLGGLQILKNKTNKKNKDSRNNKPKWEQEKKCLCVCVEGIELIKGLHKEPDLQSPSQDQQHLNLCGISDSVLSESLGNILSEGNHCYTEGMFPGS